METTEQQTNIIEEDEADFETINATEIIADGFETEAAKSAEGLAGENNFQHGSLEEIKTSLGLDFLQWEKTAESLGGDVLKKGGRELLFETEEGQKVSTTEQVKGSAIENSHLQILDGLYDYGFAVSEFISHGPGEPSRELHIYFANEKGQVSYEIYKFRETQGDEDITQSPEPKGRQDLTTDLSPAEAELIVISLDEFLELPQVEAGKNSFVFTRTEEIGPQFFTEPAVTQDQFNFQKFFVQGRQTAQANPEHIGREVNQQDNEPASTRKPAVDLKTVKENGEENFGILVVVESVGTVSVPETEPIRNSPFEAAGPKTTKTIAPQETIHLIKKSADNNFVRQIGFEAKQVIKEKVEPITETFRPKINLEEQPVQKDGEEPAGQATHDNQTIRREIPQVKKNEIPTPILSKVAQDGQNNGISFQPKSGRQYKQNSVEKTGQQLAPVVKFYHREILQNPTRSEIQISASKIEAGQGIIAEVEPEDINNLKAKPRREYIQGPSIKVVPEAAPKIATTAQPHHKEARPVEKLEIPRLKIDVREQVITKDGPEVEVLDLLEAEPLPIIKVVPAKEHKEYQQASPILPLQEINSIILKEIKDPRRKRRGIQEEYSTDSRQSREVLTFLNSSARLPLRAKTDSPTSLIKTEPQTELQQAFYDFLEKRDVIPASEPIIIENKASAAPRATLKILQRIIPPQREVAIQANQQGVHVQGVKTEPLRALPKQKPYEGRPAAPTQPNILRQITLLSSPNLKTAPQSPATIKAIPIKQTILATEAQDQTPKPGINEINTRRAIPVDQIIDEKTRPASRGQALQIAA